MNIGKRVDIYKTLFFKFVGGTKKELELIDDPRRIMLENVGSTNDPLQWIYEGVITYQLI